MSLVNNHFLNITPQAWHIRATQPEPKRSDMHTLHRSILEISPACKLWFLDGKNSENKTVSNPNIGYGLRTISMQMEQAGSFTKLV